MTNIRKLSELHLGYSYIYPKNGGHHVAFIVFRSSHQTPLTSDPPKHHPSTKALSRPRPLASRPRPLASPADGLGLSPCFSPGSGGLPEGYSPSPPLFWLHCHLEVVRPFSAKATFWRLLAAVAIHDVWTRWMRKKIAKI